MASNSIINYMKNIGESVKFAAIEHVKEQMPITHNFVEENKETFNEVYKSVSNIRMALPRLGRVEDNMLFKKANEAFRNIKTDLSSGKFYHPEREDPMAMLGALGGLMGGDFMDELNAIFSGDFGDEDEEGNPVQPTRPEMMVTKGDALVASALFQSQKTSTNCIGKLMTKLHEHGNQVNRAQFTMQLAQSQKQLGVTQAGFDLMTQGFNHIIEFNNQVLKTHVDNSQKFYENASKTLNESNAILKSIHEIQSSIYKQEHTKNGKMVDDPLKDAQPIDFRTLFKNGFNIQTYKQMVDSRFKNSELGMMYGLVTALPGMLQQYIDNPLHHLTKQIVSGVIGDQINYQLQQLDQTIKGAFSTGLLNLFNYGKANKNSMLGKLASMLGFKQEEKKLSQIDTSKFERGPMAWNGIAQKALTFVIPSHLARIEAALTGKGERYFDMGTGKFIDGGAAKNYEKNLKTEAVNRSTANVDKFLSSMFNNMQFNGAKGVDAEKAFRKYNRALKEAIYDYGGVGTGFDQYLLKNYKKYDIKNFGTAQFLAIQTNLIPPQEKIKIAENVANAKAAKNDKLENDAAQNANFSEYLLRGSTNGMIMNQNSQKPKSGSSSINSISSSSNPPIWGVKLTELEDHRGNTVYDYLYMILNRLYQMDSLGGGKRKGKRGGPNGPTPPNIDDILKTTRTKRVDALDQMAKDAEKNSNKKGFDFKALKERAEIFKSINEDYEAAKAILDSQGLTFNDLENANMPDDLKMAIYAAFTERQRAITEELDKYHTAHANRKRKTKTKGYSTIDDKEKVDMTNFEELFSDENFGSEETQKLIRQFVKVGKEQNENYMGTQMKSASSMFDIFNGPRDRSKYHKLPDNIKQEDSILSQLIAANDAGQVMDVVRHNIDALVDSPRVVMSSVIGKANEAVYDLLFGRNVGEVDKDGNPIHGIFQKMVKEIDKQSEGIGASIKEFLKEAQKLFNDEGPLSFIGDFFKKNTGIDVTELGKSLGKKAKNLFTDIGSEAFDALKSQGRTIKQYGHEAMQEAGLVNEKGHWIFGSTYRNEKEQEEAEAREREMQMDQRDAGVATGARSFHGRGGIVSKGELIVRPWDRYGTGAAVVKNTGYLDPSQLPNGAMVLSNRDASNPYRTGSSLYSDLYGEGTVRDSMRNGITRRAALADVPGYAGGSKKVEAKDPITGRTFLVPAKYVDENGQIIASQRARVMMKYSDKMTKLNYMMEYNKNKGTGISMDDLNAIVKTGLFYDKQKALFSRIMEQKVRNGDFGDLDSKDPEEKKSAEEKKKSFERDFLAIQETVLKLMSTKENDLGMHTRAKGLERDESGNINIGSTAKREFAETMTSQDELERYNYTKLDNIRKFLEQNGLGDLMPSDEDIGRTKFSKKQGPITGLRQGMLAATGTDPMKAAELFKNYMVKEKKTAISGGVGGALLSMVLPLGGPLMGAVVGAGVNLLRKSDTFNDYMFGKEIVDAQGNKTGERDNSGMFSQETIKIFNKYAPDMKKYGTLGAIAGLITPFGPYGGAMIGAAASLVKNNETLNRMVFGKNGGLLNDKRKEAIKKAFPHVAMSTISMVLLGPFGLLGNAAVGAGLGMLSTTEMFKKLVLGTKGRDGIRRGGLAGVIRRQVVEPIKATMDDARKHLGDWFKGKVFNPIAEGLKPLGRVAKGLFEGASKKVLGGIEDFLTGKRGFLPEIATKFFDNAFSGIRKAGGLGQWLTQSAIGKTTEFFANRAKDIGQGIENYALTNGLTSGYTAKQAAEVFARTGEKSERTDAINKLANMSDDEILKLNQASQLLKMNREDAVKKYENDQNEEASLLKNDVYKLSEGAEGEEKNEIAYLAESMNTDTFNKLAKAKSNKERNKIINSMMANTGISKENRLKMKGMLLNSLQKHQELESRKQEAMNGDYQKTALEAMKKSYGKEDMGDQQFLDFLDRTGASEFLANTASDVEDRKFANKDEEENAEETVEVIEGNNAIVNQNTESIEKLTDAINSLTEMLEYQNGDIEAKDLKYQDNINSTKNLAARDIVNQGNYQDVADAFDEAAQNMPDRQKSLYENIQDRDVKGTVVTGATKLANKAANAAESVASAPAKLGGLMARNIRDISSGDKKFSAKGALKGAIQGVGAAGAAGLFTGLDIPGSAGAIAGAAARGAVEYADVSSDVDKANGWADQWNWASYVIKHKDDPNITEKDYETAKNVKARILMARKAITNGKDENKYTTSSTLFDQISNHSTISGFIGLDIPIIGKIHPDKIDTLTRNKKLMKKIAKASSDERQKAIEKAYEFGPEYGKKIEDLVKKAVENYGSKEERNTDTSSNENESNNLPIPTTEPVPGYAVGGSVGGFLSKMKDAALEGGNTAAKEHIAKTKESTKQHFDALNPFSVSKPESSSYSSALTPVTPPEMMKSGAAEGESTETADDRGAMTKEVTTSEGDIITYVKSGQDGSWTIDNSKDNQQAEAKLEEKREQTRRQTNALEAIAQKLGALKAKGNEIKEQGKGLLDDLLDFLKTPFKWLGGAIAGVAGTIGSLLMTKVIKPLGSKLAELAKGLGSWIMKGVSRVGGFLKGLIPKAVSGIAGGIMNLLKKNKVIGAALGIGGALFGKKVYDAFDSDSGYQEEVEGFNSRENGLGSMSPQEQKIASEMVEDGKSSEEITQALNERRKDMTAKGERDEVKGDKANEKLGLAATLAPWATGAIGSIIGKRFGHKNAGFIAGMTMGDQAAGIINGEAPSLGGMAWDAAQNYGWSKAIDYVSGKFKGDYAAGRDAALAEREAASAANAAERGAAGAAQQGEGFLSKAKKWASEKGLNVANKGLDYALKGADAVSGALTKSREMLSTAGTKAGELSKSIKDLNALGKIEEFIGKAKELLESFVKGVSKLLPSGAGEGLKNVVNNIISKLKPENLKQYVPKLSKVLAGAAIGGPIIVGALGVYWAGKAFYEGYQKETVCEIFNTEEDKVTTPMQIISGIVHGLIAFNPIISILVDLLMGGTKGLLKTVVEFVGPLVGYEPGKESEEATEETNEDTNEETSESEDKLNIGKDTKEDQSFLGMAKNVLKSHPIVGAAMGVAKELSDINMEAIKTAITSKITDIMGTIKTSVSRFVTSNVREAIIPLGTTIVAEIVNNAQILKQGIDKLKSKAGDAVESIASNIMNFDPKLSVILTSFMAGMSKAHEVLGVPIGAATQGMKEISGIITALITAIPFLTGFLPEKALKNLVIENIGAAAGVSKEDIDKIKRTFEEKEKTDSTISIANAEDRYRQAQGGQGKASASIGIGRAAASAHTEGSASRVAEQASSTWQSVKDTASSAWESAKSMASSAWQGAKNLASSAWEGAKNFGSRAWNAAFGSSKYGMDKGLFLQSDPRFGDRKQENCLSFALANLEKNKYGGNVTPIDFMREAQSSGDKVENDGTKPGFVQKAMSRRGFDVKYVSKGEAKSKMITDPNASLILEGTDSRGVNPRTPFAGKHYVAVAHMSRDGKGMKVMDSQPDTRRGSSVYNTDETLNHSGKIIALTPKKQGRGKSIVRKFFDYARSKFGMSKYGMGTAEDEKLAAMMKIAAITAKRVGSKHPEFFFAQMIHETGGPSQILADNAKMNFDDHNYGGFTWYEGMGEKYKGWPRPSNEGGYYAKFESDEEYADMWYRKVFASYAADLAKAETPEQYAKVLKDNGYYAADLGEYTNALNSHLKDYKDELKNIGNIDVSNISTGGGGSTTPGGGSSSGNKPLGFFGALAKLIGALNPFNFDFSKGSQGLVDAANSFKNDVKGGGGGNAGGASGSSGGKVDVPAQGNAAEAMRDAIGMEITSPYGPRELMGHSFHHGVDYGAPEGTKIPALMNATVDDVGTENGYGNYVVLKDKNNHYHIAAHLSDNSLVSKGAQVNKGDVIGISGSTGQGTGPHLHYGIYTDPSCAGGNGAVDPSGYSINGLGKYGMGKKIDPKFDSNGNIGYRDEENGLKKAIHYGQNKFLNLFGSSRFGNSKYGKGATENKNFIWEWLRDPKKGGLNNAAAAGIMGSIQQESGFKPKINQGSMAETDDAPPPAGEGENGYGLCQWTGSRTQKLIEYAASKGKPSGDLETQLEFMKQEAEERGVWAKMAAADDPVKASEIWTKEYEGCGVVGDRHKYAQQIFDSDGKGEVGESSYKGGSGGSSGSSGNALVDRLMGKINGFIERNPAFKQMMTFLFGSNPFANLFGSSGGSSGGAGASGAIHGSVPPSKYAEKILEEARSHIGKPYSMAAGTGPNSYDCSGHAQTSYAAAGLEVPRTSDDQYEFFKGKNALVDIGQSQPGDMIFFENTYQTETTNNNGITHVGIVSASGDASSLQMIHASSSKGVIECGMSSWHQEHLPSGRPCIGSLSLAFGGATKDDDKVEEKSTNPDDLSNYKVDELAPNGKEYDPEHVKYLMDNGYSKEEAVEELSKNEKYSNFDENPSKVTLTNTGTYLDNLFKKSGYGTRNTPQITTDDIPTVDNNNGATPTYTGTGSYLDNLTKQAGQGKFGKGKYGKGVDPFAIGGGFGGALANIQNKDGGFGDFIANIQGLMQQSQASGGLGNVINDIQNTVDTISSRNGKISGDNGSIVVSEDSTEVPNATASAPSSTVTPTATSVSTTTDINGSNISAMLQAQNRTNELLGAILAVVQAAANSIGNSNGSGSNNSGNDIAAGLGGPIKAILSTLGGGSSFGMGDKFLGNMGNRNNSQGDIGSIMNAMSAIVSR